MTDFLFILLLGLGDRVRGSGWFRFNHFTGMLLMNMAAIGLIHHALPWQYAYLLLAPCIGYAPALMPELSDAWAGKFNPKLVLRGALWGLPFALINPLFVIPFALSFITLGFVFGSAERKFGQFRKYGMDWWGVMEFTRGLLSGVGLYVISQL